MHTGSMDGRTALIGLLPDDHVGVYVFGNADHVELRHAIMLKVFDLYTDAPPRDWSTDLLKLYGDGKAARDAAIAAQEKKRVKGTRPSLPLSKYTGRYVHPAWGDIEISELKGKLKIRFGIGEENVGILQHWNYDSFRGQFGDGRYGWTMFQFALAPDGSVSSVAAENSDEYRFIKERTP